MLLYWYYYIPNSPTCGNAYRHLTILLVLSERYVLAQGLEPQFTEPKSVVLPLDEARIGLQM